jgi:hypothetical protein
MASTSTFQWEIRHMLNEIFLDVIRNLQCNYKFSVAIGVRQRSLEISNFMGQVDFGKFIAFFINNLLALDFYTALYSGLIMEGENEHTFRITITYLESQMMAFYGQSPATLY